MPLESCMILIDNSEYMRNGDYIPTRFESQKNAANLIVNHKLHSNPESTIGIIAMSGATCTGPAELLISTTDDIGKVLSALHEISVRGKEDLDSGLDLASSVQVASLALKYRRNKNGQQRIILFIGSPLGVESRTLTRIGRMCKKNNIAIDVVAIGELDENEDKLKELVTAANGNRESDRETSCHLVTVPTGSLPSEVLLGSPILSMGDTNIVSGSSQTADPIFAEFGGVDPNMDPELAMALRISMEEERVRQEQEVTNSEPGTSISVNGNNINQGDNTTEDDLLQQALTMSMVEVSGTNIPESVPDTQDVEIPGDEDETTMQLALKMSMEREDQFDKDKK